MFGLVAILSLLGSDYSAAHGSHAAFEDSDALGEGNDGTARIEVPASVNNLLAIEQAQVQRPQRWLRAYGRVTASPSAITDVNAYVSGEVRSVFVRPGEWVKAGNPLISIYSPEFISTQRSHVALYNNKERLAILRDEGRLPDYLKDAEENLRWWGMSDKQIHELMEQGKIIDEITVDAPTSGTVTELFVQPGAILNAGDKTMKAFLVTGQAVARMNAAGGKYWIEGILYADEIAMCSPNAHVNVQLDKGRTLQGRVTQIVPYVEGRTQSARLIVDVQETLASVPVGSVVNLQIERTTASGVWIPREAVYSQGLKPVVYVRDPQGKFERRQVKVVDASDQSLSVDGIKAGEAVVVGGKVILEGIYRMSSHAGHDAHHSDEHH